MNDTLTVDDLTLEVRRSTRRKTLEITVDRAGDLIVAAPMGLDEPTIDRFVREKRGWIYRKLAEKEMYWRPRPPRQFVTGEGFLYLGRSYRLKLVADQDCPLKVTAGRFCLKRSEVEHGREHFVRWYTAHGQAWLSRRLLTWTRRLGVEPTGLQVRNLGHRWGSCTPAGTINVHWTTMQLPGLIIDYVLVHELAHLRQPDHGDAFWRLVQRALPEYPSRRRWLAEAGHEHAGI